MRRVGLFVVLAMLIAGAAGCTVHSNSRDREEARREAEQAKEEAKRAGDEAKEEGRRAAEEARREAEDAARDAKQQGEEARRQADEARREALAQADDARREAQQQADEARREALAQTRNDHDHSRSGDMVNINSADAQQIQDATGVSADMARKIVAARPYVSKRDLVSKKVVDEQTYWKIQKNITVMSR